MNTEDSIQHQVVDWDLEIDAGKSKAGFGFRDVFKYRDLIVLFARRDFVSIFKQSILGPLWLVLQPALKVAIFYFVFGRLMAVSTDGVPPILFYLTGLAFWELFASNVRKVSGSLLLNQHVLGKVYFNRLVIPFSLVLSNFIRTAVLFGLLLIVWGYYYLQGGLVFRPEMLLLPVIALLIAMLGAGIGMYMAAVTTVFRDLRFVIDSALQILFYLSPVIYPLSLVDGLAGKLFWVNPMVAFLETSKSAILGVGQFQPLFLSFASFLSIAVFFVGAFQYQKASQDFIDRV